MPTMANSIHKEIFQQYTCHLQKVLSFIYLSVCIVCYQVEAPTPKNQFNKKLLKLKFNF